MRGNGRGLQSYYPDTRQSDFYNSRDSNPVPQNTSLKRSKKALILHIQHSDSPNISTGSTGSRGLTAVPPRQLETIPECFRAPCGARDAAQGTPSVTPPQGEVYPHITPPSEVTATSHTDWATIALVFRNRIREVPTASVV